MVSNVIGSKVFYYPSAQICFYPCGNINNCNATCVNGTAHIYPPYQPTKVPDDITATPTELDFGHDLAVLTFDSDVTQLGLGPYMVPRRINTPSFPPSANENIQLVGYGVSSPGGSDYGQKRYGFTFVTSVAPETFDYNESSTFMAVGDSGSPVFDHGSGPYHDCVIGVANGKDVTQQAVYVNSRTDNNGKPDWIQQVAHAANDFTVYACGVTVCGDGFCQDPETCSTCPQDCGQCCDSVTCPNGCCDANMVCHTPGNVNGACGSYSGVGCDICNPSDNGFCRSCPRGYLCVLSGFQCPR
jgi:hypothetical protein